MLGRREDRWRWALGLILATALVIRIAAVLLTRHLPMRDDSLDYQRLGSLLAAGRGFGTTGLAAGGGPTAFRAPAYPIFVGAVFRVTGDSLTAVRLVQSVLGTLVVGLIAFVASELFDRRHGLVAAALASVYPPLILLGNGLLTEAISLPLESGALAAALLCRRWTAGRSPTDAPWVPGALVGSCGLLLGLAILTRPVDAVLALPVVVLVAPRSGGRAVVRAGLVVGIAIVMLLPWEVRDARAFDRLIPVTTQDGYILSGVYNDQAARDPLHRAVWRPPVFVAGFEGLFRDVRLNEATLDDALRRRSQAYAEQHPAYVARVVVTNVLYLFDLLGPGHARPATLSIGYGTRLTDVWVLSFYAMGILAVAGLVVRPRRAVPTGVWLAPALFVLATVPTLGTTRYRAPIEPYLVVLGAAAVVWVIDQARPANG